MLNTTDYLTSEDVAINRRLGKRFDIWGCLDYCGTVRVFEISETVRCRTAADLRGRVPPAITCTDWDHLI